MNSHLAQLCKPNDKGLDIDEWDKYAEHYGLFECNEDQQTPVGCIRFIKKGKSSMCDQITEIAGVTRAPRFTFPSIGYFKEGSSLHCYDENITSEASRFCIDQKVRTRALGFFMFETMLSVFYKIIPFRHVILSCSEAHSRLYRKFGGEDIEFVPHQNFIDKIGIRCLIFTPEYNAFTNSLKGKNIKNNFLSNNYINYQAYKNDLSFGKEKTSFLILSEAV